MLFFLAISAMVVSASPLDSQFAERRTRHRRSTPGLLRVSISRPITKGSPESSPYSVPRQNPGQLHDIQRMEIAPHDNQQAFATSTCVPRSRTFLIRRRGCRGSVTLSVCEGVCKADLNSKTSSPTSFQYSACKPTATRLARFVLPCKKRRKKKWKFRSATLVVTFPEAVRCDCLKCNS